MLDENIHKISKIIGLKSVLVLHETLLNDFIDIIKHLFHNGVTNLRENTQNGFKLVTGLTALLFLTIKSIENKLKKKILKTFKYYGMDASIKFYPFEIA